MGYLGVLQDDTLGEYDNMGLDKVVVLIPSLDPDENLPRYVENLSEQGFREIVVVDDGSTINANTFRKLEQTGITVLHHEVNYGKGRALRTGFQYILNKYKEGDISGVVTADADGQHSVVDTIAVAKKLEESRGFVLGCRNLKNSNVPPKSRFGNNLTTLVFAFLYGKRIEDTQTGLRGIEYDLLSDCLECKGDRFQYELDVLIRMVEKKVLITQIEIETIYYEGNRATHFSAIKDSLRIYSVLFGQWIRYAFSSFSSFLVDVVLFAFLSKIIFKSNTLVNNVLLSTMIARIISCTYNFLMNQRIVFKADNSQSSQFVKYFILAICQLTVSWLLVVKTKMWLGWDTTGLKVIVDTCLFFISFQVQKHWVFKNGK